MNQAHAILMEDDKLEMIYHSGTEQVRKVRKAKMVLDKFKGIRLEKTEKRNSIFGLVIRKTKSMTSKENAPDQFQGYFTITAQNILKAEILDVDPQLFRVVPRGVGKTLLVKAKSSARAKEWIDCITNFVALIKTQDTKNMSQKNFSPKFLAEELIGERMSKKTESSAAASSEAGDDFSYRANARLVCEARCFHIL